MKQYHLLQALYMSFYSKKLYQDVASNWGGYALLYLLLLLVLSWIPVTYYAQRNLVQSYTIYSDGLIAQIPELVVKDGKLSTPQPRPYFINIAGDEDHSHLTMVIDTTGQYQDLQQTHTNFLITENKIITQKNANEIRINTFPKNLNLTIIPKDINIIIKRIISYAWVVFFITMVFLSFVFRLIQAIIYSLLGEIFAMLFSTRIAFVSMMQISLVAITPAVVIDTVLTVFNIHFQQQLLYYFLLSILYLFYGILANKE
jgi:hypothetical protein